MGLMRAVGGVCEGSGWGWGGQWMGFVGVVDGDCEVSGWGLWGVVDGASGDSRWGLWGQWTRLMRASVKVISYFSQGIHSTMKAHVGYHMGVNHMVDTVQCFFLTF